jgi:hypothetical protein
MESAFLSIHGLPTTVKSSAAAYESISDELSSMHVYIN